MHTYCDDHYIRAGQSVAYLVRKKKNRGGMGMHSYTGDMHTPTHTQRKGRDTEKESIPPIPEHTIDPPWRAGGPGELQAGGGGSVRGNIFGKKCGGERSSGRGRGTSRVTGSVTDRGCGLGQ